MPSHKVRQSKGATLDSHRRSEGDETFEAYLCLNRELPCTTLTIMRTEARVCQT